MTDARGRTRFPQEAKPRRLVNEIFFADDFESHGATQIDVERLVSDTHRTPTQFHRLPVFVRHQLVMLQALRCGVRGRIGRILRKRLPRTQLRQRELFAACKRDKIRSLQ
jgi:hypothetical protein